MSKSSRVIQIDRRVGWHSGLRVQWRVIRALMMREALARYGHSNLGFFWVIAEPLLLTSGVMTIWSLGHMDHGDSVGVVPFALTGYSIITLWRHIVFKAARAMGRNSNLRYHRQVKFVDVILAQSLLETIGIFAAFTIALIPLILLGFCPFPRDPLTLIVAFALTGWFSSAFGMVLSAISELNEVVEHLIQPLIYLTLPITGVFFMVDWLPESVQSYMQWSPLVNGSEMFRGGLFPSDVVTHWSALYLLGWCFVLSTVGLLLLSLVEDRVEA